MTGETLATRLRREHRTIIEALHGLRQALLDRDRERALEAVDRLDLLSGPHIRFEEEWLFPALADRLDQRRLDDLTREHAEVASIVRHVRARLAAPAVAPDGYTTLAKTLAPFFAHTVACDGLNVQVSHCSPAQQARLLEALDQEQTRSLPLTQYRSR